MAKNQGYIISIKRIKELSFFVNESLYIQDPTKLLRIELSQKLLFTFETNQVDLTLRVYYHYPESPNEILMETTVQNVFEIPDLKHYQIGERDIELPSEMMVTLVSLSISHTRALLAKNTSGTVFQDTIMAIVNPVDVAMHFYPRMFKEQNTLIEGQS